MEFEKNIATRKEAENYQYLKYGDDYYLSRNTLIVNRSKKIYLEGIGVSENPFGSNHKLASGHFKKIVDQKVLYQLGKGVHFVEEDQNKQLDQYFTEPFDEIMIDLGIEASKKSEAWIYGYKKDGKLKFTKIPAEQLTPVYDEYGEMIKMIREFENDEARWIYVYDKDMITIYRKKTTDRQYKQFKTIGHWTTYQQFNGEMVGEPEEHGFGSVPFIPLWNNRERVSDLYPIKPLIDTYDIINSDFANNIDDMQDAYFTLKGYSGDVKQLGEFMKQLKMYKAIPISEDGDVNSHQAEIPTEARKVFLERLEKDIYKFAMAVDLSNFSGGSITNVYIKSMFADLDLKCDQFESEIRKFIKRLIEFINQSEGTKYTYDCGFDRSMIVNRQEVIDNIVKLSGIISDQTIRELIPYDIDLKKEDDRIKKQNGEITIDEAKQIMAQDQQDDMNDDQDGDQNPGRS